MIKLNIKVGDFVLGGKWRNKRTEVKEIGTDDMGQPTINGKPILKFRIEKLMPKKKNESMRHLKLYEDFSTRIKDPKAAEEGNKYLNAILTDKIKFDLVDPRSGSFDSDFGDSEGSNQEELTFSFKDESGTECHIAIEFTWSWTEQKAKYTGSWEQPPDPDEYTLEDITLDNVYFHSDSGLEDEFEIDQVNKDLLQNYIESKIPVDNIKTYKLS